MAAYDAYVRSVAEARRTRPVDAYVHLVEVMDVIAPEVATPELVLA
jgi:hypothetical protein